MIKVCSHDGCGATMHEQCLYEFENDINYDEDNGKVRIHIIAPCITPKKNIRNDDSDSDSDSEDDEGRGGGGN